MPREKPLFRVNLDRLDERYPNKEALSFNEIAVYFGCSLSSARRKFKYNKTISGIAKATVARALSEET